MAKRRIAQIANLQHLTEEDAVEMLKMAYNREIGFEDVPDNVLELEDRPIFEADKQRIRRDLG